ncbi:uncharacterized protein LOC119279600 [Triticum dicoccoides]|uniref:uncharacterized protein LOC119279600 n=1 Tax=Triticum dicoccoides TaxID=85692 RepID=UPI00188EE936|nr:uncharacterized protein LOC119279600 [Triticum dicoccoides]
MCTMDWAVPCLDCFSWLEMAMEAGTTVLTLWLQMFGPAREDKMVLVTFLSFVVGLHLMSLSIYYLHKLGVSEIDVTNPTRWYAVLLTFVFGGTISTFYALCRHAYYDGHHNYYLAWAVWFFGVAFEVAKLGWSILRRFECVQLKVHQEGFVKDERLVIFIKMMTSILGVAVNWMEYNELREEDTASAHLLLSLCEARMFASAFQFVVRLCDVLRTPHRQPGPPESLRQQRQNLNARELKAQLKALLKPQLKALALMMVSPLKERLKLQLKALALLKSQLKALALLMVPKALLKPVLVKTFTALLQMWSDSRNDTKPASELVTWYKQLTLKRSTEIAALAKCLRVAPTMPTSKLFKTELRGGGG